MSITDWKKVAAEAWWSSSWNTAAAEYRETHGGRAVIVEREPSQLKHLRRLLESNVWLERAFWEINDPTNRATPKVVGEAIMLAIGERGLAALKERTNIERLERCDTAAKVEINRRIEKLGLKL